jgi:hypothetical protein
VGIAPGLPEGDAVSNAIRAGEGLVEYRIRRGAELDAEGDAKREAGDFEVACSLWDDAHELKRGHADRPGQYRDIYVQNLRELEQRWAL